jgi:hypothetical protein
MHKSMVADLIGTNLRKTRTDRMLLQELFSMMEFVAQNFGETPPRVLCRRSRTLVAEELPLHEIVHGLSKDYKQQYVCSTPLENASGGGAIYRPTSGRSGFAGSGAETQCRTKWFGDTLVLGARCTNLDTFTIALHQSFCRTTTIATGSHHAMSGHGTRARRRKRRHHSV